MLSPGLLSVGCGLLVGLLLAWDRNWPAARRRLWRVLLAAGSGLLVLHAALFALGMLGAAVDGSPEENAHVRLVSGLNVVGAAALLIGGDARGLVAGWTWTGVGVSAFVCSIGLWNLRYEQIVSRWLAEPSWDSLLTVSLPLASAGLALVNAFVAWRAGDRVRPPREYSEDKRS